MADVLSLHTVSCLPNGRLALKWSERQAENQFMLKNTEKNLSGTLWTYTILQEVVGHRPIQEVVGHRPILRVTTLQNTS